MKNFFCLVFFFATITFSQGQSELGLVTGASLFSGDVNRHFVPSETKPAVGIFYRFNFLNHFALRTQIIRTTVSGSDARNESFSDADINVKMRNLSFKTPITEFNLIAEFYFNKFGKGKIPFYIFWGTGIFLFNPKAMYKGEWHELQPLGTEGQIITGTQYKRSSINGIIGIGTKYKLSKKLSISFEIGLRLTRTDYIDDVSGTYYDKAALYNNNPLSAYLSDRSGEFDMGGNQFVANQGGYQYDPYSEYGRRISGYGAGGEARGNPDNYDKYIIYNFTFSYFLSKLE